jgi:hypothetical protein
VDRPAAGTRYSNRQHLAQFNLAEAWLANDKPCEAKAVARAGWPEAARYGRQAGWADSLALLAAMEGRPRASAHTARLCRCAVCGTQKTRQPAEGITVERAERLARTFAGAG